MTDAEKVQELCQAVWNLAIANWRVASGVYPPERGEERYAELLALSQKYGKWPADDGVVASMVAKPSV